MRPSRYRCSTASDNVFRLLGAAHRFVGRKTLGFLFCSQHDDIFVYPLELLVELVFRRRNLIACGFRVLGLFLGFRLLLGKLLFGSLSKRTGFLAFLDKPRLLFGYSLEGIPKSNELLE